LGSVHEELYARVYALFTQDLDASRGLSNNASTAFCRGGMYRAGDPQRTMNAPWIEVSIGIDEDMNSADGTICLATVDLRIHGNRDKKFTGNGGDSVLNTVAQRVREVYNDCPYEKGGASDAYRISSFKRTGGGLISVGDKDLVLSERYQVLVSAKDVYFFHVYTGGVKQFLRGGFSDENRKFISLNIGDLEAPNPDIPHPGYTDRLSIVRSVTRTRVFNKFDAEYVVDYNPLDMSFMEQQRRSSLEFSTIEQEVPLYERKVTQASDGTHVWYLPKKDTFKRAAFTRTEQVKKDVGKEINTDVMLGIQNQIAADANTIRIIDGKKYLFIGATLDYNTKTGIALITATFWTTGPVKGRPPNSGQGVVYDVGLPALSYLEDYIVTEPVQTGAGSSLPVIGVRNYADMCNVGSFAWLN